MAVALFSRGRKHHYCCQGSQRGNVRLGLESTENAEEETEALSETHNLNLTCLGCLKHVVSHL